MSKRLSQEAAGTEQTEGVHIADTDDANADAQDDSDFTTDDDSDFVDAATSSTAAIPTLPEPDGTTIAVTCCSRIDAGLSQRPARG